MTKLKIMTYNVCSGHNLAREYKPEETAAFIKSEAPDIVGLNEINYKNTRSRGLDQAELLASLAGYRYFCFGRSIDYDGGEYGNAILSRFPLSHCRALPVPKTPPKKEGGRIPEPRSHLAAEADLGGGQKLALLVTHYGLSVPEQTAAVAETLRHAKDAAAAGLPLVFMGDLNATPGESHMQPLFAALSDASAKSETPYTFDSGTPTKKIDYIFTSHNIKASIPVAPAVLFSDHLPLICSVEL